jgi:predicted 3-demethylubiquinone-9 3-methyltransferase (glyoxalase superfamily)
MLRILCFGTFDGVHDGHRAMLKEARLVDQQSESDSRSASGQCGWCKDKFGLSWQIVPENMDKWLASGDSEKSGRAMQAMLKMKKINMAELQKASEGN